MLRRVATASFRARTMPVKSPPSNVIPALSIATSAPVPMAIPTSAAASAGASFTPSPAMAIKRPSLRRRSTSAFLSSGSTPARTSSMPRRSATTCAVRALSPVAMMTRRPKSCRLRRAAAVVSLIGSATATIPISTPSRARNIAVLPSSCNASAAAVAASVSSPRDCIIALFPKAMA